MSEPGGFTSLPWSGQIPFCEFVTNTFQWKADADIAGPGNS